MSFHKKKYLKLSHYSKENFERNFVTLLSKIRLFSVLHIKIDFLVNRKKIYNKTDFSKNWKGQNKHFFFFGSQKKKF